MSHRRDALVVLLLAGTLLSISCAPAPRVGSASAPGWPYAGITIRDRQPHDLRTTPLFRGGWLESAPDGRSVFLESGEPRMLIELNYDDFQRTRFYDLGPGTRVEAVAFFRNGPEMFLVTSLSSPHHQNAVVARALLEIDPGSGLMLDAMPLPRSALARGMAVDESQRRVYILQGSDAGTASIQVVDLYQGTVADQVTIGTIPGSLGRRGLVIDRNADRIFALSGGAPARSDFAPRDEEPARGPEVVVVDRDSLEVIDRIALPPLFRPRALAYDEVRDHLIVLQVAGQRSRLVLIDAGFGEIRGIVELPEETTDLVLADRYGFCPGPHGIYILDLDSETWASQASVPFDLTREIAVSGDLRLAFVRFQSAQTGGPPGIVAVDLRTGTVREVLQ